MIPRLGSVVIPAHNEESVLGRCLRALGAGFAPDDLEVVVVCNGCDDDSARTAHAAGYPVRVVELAAASKPAALRAGDDAVHAFPRLYLDADVVLEGVAARALLERLTAGPVLAARPPIRYDTAGSSAVVRRYYAARVRTPSVMTALWGAGVYGLSELGRQRFDRFPDIVADDLFVADRFAPHEFEIVDTTPATVFVPRSAPALVRVLRRSTRGNGELRSGPGGGPGSTATTTLRGLVRLPVAGPSAALDAGVYAGLALAGRVSSRWSRAAGWGRDESSRAA